MAGFFTYLFPYGLSTPVAAPPDGAINVAGVMGSALEQETIISCVGAAFVTDVPGTVTGIVVIDEIPFPTPSGVCLLAPLETAVVGSTLIEYAPRGVMAAAVIAPAPRGVAATVEVN